ncbi:alpha/beta hydrolase [Paraburkholderia sp. D15]|uniref:alpha/beta hydrolase family protein n=1 Tax=Paraburkholderia sp. D15 TaxID=2880218 RepID=UPI002479FDB2|nr:alpha/beta hydrolase [Paraburkholderia sp. D15]WGS52248.1 alpha/beta hydrolase [Paraburkholderia sp. D15]
MPVAMRTAALGLLTGFTLCAGVNVQAAADCDAACHARGGLRDHRVSLRLDRAAFAKLLASNAQGRQLAQIAGEPACGVEIVSFRYRTIGGAGEATQASGALMLPTGGASACRGPRPLLLYAHGTTPYRRYNLADITQTDPANEDGAGEGLSVAAMYAAQGFIVVASNYAGYAGSDLPYHPYLNADQQSADMIDSLHAARVVLGDLKNKHATHENGKLFITGYSQGGYVAMATHRALQAAGVTVTASAPGSGPYALAAMGDALIEGEVNLGATLFTTMIVNGYQRAYGNLYGKPGDFYEAAYAPGIDTLLPSTQPLDALFAAKKLPPSQLFSSVPPAPQFASMTPPVAASAESTGASGGAITPVALTPMFAAGFGRANLVRNTYRLSLLEDAAANPDGAFPNATAALTPAAHPQQPLRQALARNDLRNWQPHAPVLMCGGQADPMVFFSNARIEAAYWRNAKVPAGLASVLDVDSPATGSDDPYAPVKQGFASAKASVAKQAVANGATDGGASAVLQAYHGELVASFCMVAARAFFANF